MIAPHIASWALAKRNSNEGVAATAVTSITPVKKQRKRKQRVLRLKVVVDMYHLHNLVHKNSRRLVTGKRSKSSNVSRHGKMRLTERMH